MRSARERKWLMKLGGWMRRKERTPKEREKAKMLRQDILLAAETGLPVMVTKRQQTLEELETLVKGRHVS